MATLQSLRSELKTIRKEVDALRPKHIVAIRLYNGDTEEIAVERHCKLTGESIDWIKNSELQVFIKTFCDPPTYT